MMLMLQSFKFQTLCTHFIHGWVSCLFQIDFIWFIVYSQIVRTSQILDSVTHIVLDMHREIVLLDDFLDQNICAISLESIILPIESDIMWISPTGTFACNFEEQELQCSQCTNLLSLVPFKVVCFKFGISELEVTVFSRFAMMTKKSGETNKQTKKIKLTLAFIMIATPGLIIDLNRREFVFTHWHRKIWVDTLHRFWDNRAICAYFIFTVFFPAFSILSLMSRKKKKKKNAYSKHIE